MLYALQTHKRRVTDSYNDVVLCVRVRRVCLTKRELKVEDINCNRTKETKETSNRLRQEPNLHTDLLLHKNKANSLLNLPQSIYRIISKILRVHLTPV